MARRDWCSSSMDFLVCHIIAALKFGRRICIDKSVDSWYLWHSFVKNPQLKDDAILIAVDLPGYGGSDSFPSHDAQTILESLTVFMMSMREEYLPTYESDKKTRGPVVV